MNAKAEDTPRVNNDALETQVSNLMADIDRIEQKLLGAESKAACLESLLLSLHGLEIVNLTDLLNEARIFRHVANVLEIMVSEGKIQDYRDETEDSEDEESEDEAA